MIIHHTLCWMLSTRSEIVTLEMSLCFSVILKNFFSDNLEIILYFLSVYFYQSLFGE